ncbi:MAG TPA: crosslink repair DNA glycosylase YcaQ family protein [Bacillales bacterium]|nr:crosslink repair DNA glycosylase YcaQ family protein [Bacillales bacterium]
MEKAQTVDRTRVRQFLLKKQQLFTNPNTEHSGKEAALRMVEHLECVQLDPVSVVERNQHLVLAARVPGYRPKYLAQHLSEGKLFEFWANAACAIPMRDYPIFKAIRMRRLNHIQPHLEALRAVQEMILDRLRKEGPLPSRAFDSETKVHGYWDNEKATTKATSHALNLLMDAGIIRVVQREGVERYYHLTESSIPLPLLEADQKMEMETSKTALVNKYMRAYTIFDPRDARFGWINAPAAERRAEIEHRVDAGTVVPIEIPNVRRRYYMTSEDFEALQAVEPIAQEELEQEPVRFLAPLDNLLWSRDRLVDLFDFHYRWEIYVPKAKRKFGPYAMPILYGDRLIGRMNPSLDRKNKGLCVELLQLEPSVKMTQALAEKLKKALHDFSMFHGAENVTIAKIEPASLLRTLSAI